MEVVKLMRFSVARNHDFCRLETVLPMAKEDAVKTDAALSDFGHCKTLIGQMGRLLTYHHQNRCDTHRTDLGF